MSRNFGVGIFVFLLALSGIANASLPNDVTPGANCSVTINECVDNDGLTYTTPDNNVWEYNTCAERHLDYICTTGETLSSCADEQLGGCSMTDETIGNTYSDGTPKYWVQNWVCPNDVTGECSVSNDQGETVNVPYDKIRDDSFCSIEKEQCLASKGGKCIEKSATYICQNPTTPCIDPDEVEDCTLADSVCISSVQGSCLTEQQTWECSTKTQECVAYKKSDSCNSDMTKGFDQSEGNDNAESLAKVAIHLQVAQAIENDISGVPPRIFAGESLHCTDTFAKGVMGNDCCSTNATAGDGGWADCTEEDEKTAIVRKADRAKWVASGDLVRPEIDLGFTSFCSFVVKKRQYYCGFSSMLARIIQEQGREQLKQIAINGAPGGTAETHYKYAAGSGSWNTVSMAGYTIKLRTYPEECRTSTSVDNSECPDSLRTKVVITGNGLNITRRVKTQADATVELSKNLVAMPGDFGTMCNMDPDTSTYGDCHMKFKAFGDGSNAGSSTSSTVHTFGYPYAEGTGTTNTFSVDGYTVDVDTHPAECLPPVLDQYIKPQEPAPGSTEPVIQCPADPVTTFHITGNGVDMTRSFKPGQVVDSFAIDSKTLFRSSNFGALCQMDDTLPDYGDCSFQLQISQQTAGGGGGNQVTAPVVIAASRYADEDQWSNVVFGGDSWEFKFRQTDFQNNNYEDTDPVRIAWRKSGDTDWTTEVIPSPLSPNANYRIGGAQIYGRCHMAQCRYTVRIPLDGIIKPWIEKSWEEEGGCEQLYTTNCEGFTLTEFQMLDIEAMDLSEFEASIQEKVKNDLPDSKDFKTSMEPRIESGVAKTESGQKADFKTGGKKKAQYAARLESGEVLVGETAHLKAIPFWPGPTAEVSDPADSVHVDWGDGHSEALTLSGDFYRGSHSYSSSGEFTVLVTHKMPDGSEHYRDLLIVVQDPNNPIPSLGGTPF